MTSTVPADIEHSPFSRASNYSEAALAGVYEISKLLASPYRLEVTLSGVLRLLSSFLDMDHGLIALLDPDGEPEMVAGAGWNEANAKDYFDRLPERVVGQIVATQMPLVVPNVHDDPLFAEADFTGWAPDDETPLAVIGVPIKIDDKVIGTLTIDRLDANLTLGRFDRDVRFLSMIANLVGQTVRLHKIVARDRERLMEEQRRLEKVLSSTGAKRPAKRIEGIVGNSPALQAVVEKICIVARTHSSVLLRGESGTGKELFANAIHSLSPRRNSPFVKLNCMALPESVLESELFGHEKGAFTGAAAQRKGRFEQANGGTLFLDEIGDISPSFQAKLLRVLQEGEFERVGSSRTIRVDVRLVCATNRNLEEAVSRGEFRADLYYRISVVPIFLPALRDRKSDLPLLAAEFLRRFNAEHGTELTLSDAALSVLGRCYFPGNIRELENCVRHTATLARGPSIDSSDFACQNDGCLSAMLWRGPEPPPSRAGGFTPLPIAPSAAVVAPSPPPSKPAPTSASQPPAAVGSAPSEGEGGVERDRLIRAMEMSGWVQAKAARLLGLTPRQIGYALRKYGIEIKRF